MVEGATGLKFKSPPKVETRTRDELRAFLETKFNEDQPALELAGQERAYKLFGVLPDSLELREFLLKLLGEQVVGYYDPATKVLYVVSGEGGAAPPPEVLNVTITHELVHALQDQYLPLDSIAKLRHDNDRVMAAQAVIEGGATYEQLSVMLGGASLAARMPGGWDRVRQTIRDAQAMMPVFATAPMFIQETLLFPYLSGAEFVRQFKARRPGVSPLTALPVSTEQVLHPGRLLDSLELPVSVALPRPASGSIVYEGGLGEFETRLVLHQFLRNAESAARGADGWAGDRFYVVSVGGGAALAWLTVWDSQFEAAEFRDLLARAVAVKAERDDDEIGEGRVLRLTGKGRQHELTAVTVQGRAAVLYVDAPAGAPTKLVDLARVRLGGAP